MSKATMARRAAILEILSRGGFSSIPELTRELGASQATIRRDLAHLHGTGRLRRTYGGAVSNAVSEVPYREKLAEAANEKARIAQLAASLVEPGSSIGITGGTTALFVARRLPRGAGLTVVTNALTTAMELAGSEIRIIVTGGELRGTTFELVGPLSETVLQQIHLDTVFVGVDGISPESGLTTHNTVEAQTNRWLIDRATRAIVVADGRKLGRRTFAQIVPLERADLLITDAGADPEQVRSLRTAGVEVLLAS
jgi:DeoR family transcriptional regulator, aga operon transcriptional repressor